MSVALASAVHMQPRATRATAHAHSVARPLVTVAAPKIVAIGGGTGLPSVLEGLCASHPRGSGVADRDAITAVVTVTDDGGSSGRLRQQFGVLPPGDVRNCLVAVAERDSPLRDLLQHRFRSGDALEGHAIGNLLLTALTQMTGDFPQAVERLGEIIGLRGRVLPTTGENVRLCAEMQDGAVVTGETSIVSHAARIRRLSLVPSPRPLPDVLRAIINADAIVVGPGSLYTSVLPNLLVEGMASTISGVNAVRIYVANLMTEPGETDGYTLDDHLRVIREHTGHDLFDYILVNRRPVEGPAAERYAAQGSRPVARDLSLAYAGRARVVECDLTLDGASGKIRHHPRPLAEAIRALIEMGRP